MLIFLILYDLVSTSFFFLIFVEESFKGLNKTN
jgi:hypothetical protein